MTMKEISDLALASYLSVIGYKILSIKPDKNKMIFIFEKSNNLEADILGFFNRVTKVDALSFAETMRNLKALALRG